NKPKKMGGTLGLNDLLGDWVIEEAETHIWFREYPTQKIKCQICGIERLPDNQLMIDLHKKIESRINKLEQPVLGLKGGVNREAVLKIIEEEFGRLGDMDNL